MGGLFLPSLPFLPSFQKKLTRDWKEGGSEAFEQETSRRSRLQVPVTRWARAGVCVCVRSLAGVAPVIQERLRRAVPPLSVT